jgi:ribA/ribD-fused uncharacterized protein
LKNKANISNIKELLDYVNQGKQPGFVFFWGHTSKQTVLNKTCLSQWYETTFSIDQKLYPTAEHFMMAAKARLFADFLAEGKILKANNPGLAKGLGRKVQGFDSKRWFAHRTEIVVQANLAKFGQNPTLKKYLLGTGTKILVEASPVDKIWGVGLAEDNPDIYNPNKWQGLNLLGFALMQVRDQLD